MGKGFETLLVANGRVIVILHVGCKASKDDILNLLNAVGIDPEMVTFVEPEAPLNPEDLGDSTVLIPINEETCDAPALANVGLQCGQAGNQVIVILEPGFAFSGLNPIAEKYGTQCGWSADDLRRCVSKTEPGEPTDSSGTPVARASAKQVDC